MHSPVLVACKTNELKTLKLKVRTVRVPHTVVDLFHIIHVLRRKIHPYLDPRGSYFNWSTAIQVKKNYILDTNFGDKIETVCAFTTVHGFE